MALAALGSQLDELALSGGDYLTFNSMQGCLQAPRSKTPRYLFRVFTPKSQGLTNATWVKSMDARWNLANCTVDLFARTARAQTADMIHRHLQWWRGDDDNLVSWTSSLLFALVYIFHLHANESHGSDFQDIFLCVIDTRGLPDNVFIRDMDLVAAFREEHLPLQQFEGMRRAYYFGEYLTQGALKIESRCQIISAQLIIENGLYDIRLEFEGFANWKVQKTPPWAKPARGLREIFDYGDSERHGITRDGLTAALAIARLFEAPWRLPMAASFVALAAPRTDDNAILLAFRSSSFTDNARRDCCLQDTRFEADHMLPEVNEYLNIMKSIYKDYYLNKFKEHLTGIESALRNLRLFTMSEDFINYENSQTEASFSLVDVSHDALLNKFRTLSFLSDRLHQRLSTNEEQSL